MSVFYHSCPQSTPSPHNHSVLTGPPSPQPHRPPFPRFIIVFPAMLQLHSTVRSHSRCLPAAVGPRGQLAQHTGRVDYRAWDAFRGCGTIWCGTGGRAGVCCRFDGCWLQAAGPGKLTRRSSAVQIPHAQQPPRYPTRPIDHTRHTTRPTMLPRPVACRRRVWREVVPAGIASSGPERAVWSRTAPASIIPIVRYGCPAKQAW